MYLKSISGQILFEGRFHTVRQAVEQAVKEKICLDSIDLRGVNLVGAELDDARMNKACLWGVDFTGSNLSGVLMQESDCRNSNLKDCCLAEANCYKTDFQGSYFSSTIVRDADLSNIKLSCPSFFNLDLREVKTLKNAIYSHRGEVDCDISSPLIVIRGLEKDIVLMNKKIMVGSSLYNFNCQKEFLSSFQNLIQQEEILKKERVK